MKKYYVIVGFNEGEAITPSLLEGDKDLEFYINCYGDCSRFYYVFDTLQEARTKLKNLLNKRRPLWKS